MNYERCTIRTAQQVLIQELYLLLFIRAVAVELLRGLFQHLKELSFFEHFKEPRKDWFSCSSSFFCVKQQKRQLMGIVHAFVA
jgi:hypothetical protein